MGFVDTVKELAEKVGDTVDKGIKTGSDSYKKMTEKSRLKKETVRLNSEINDIFASIGRKLYNDDPESKEYKAAFDNIRAKSAEIEELKRQLTVLEDKIACKSCGEYVSKDSKYCDKCGAKIEQPAPAPTPEPEIVEAEEVRVCRNCGAELVEAARFCDKCGARLDD